MSGIHCCQSEFVRASSYERARVAHRAPSRSSEMASEGATRTGDQVELHSATR